MVVWGWCVRRRGVYVCSALIWAYYTLRVVWKRLCQVNCGNDDRCVRCTSVLDHGVAEAFADLRSRDVALVGLSTRTSHVYRSFYWLFI